MNPHPVRLAGRCAAGFMLVLLSTACSANWNPPALGPDRGTQVLTAGEIQHSGATNAWEVLEQTGIYIPSGTSPLIPRAQSRREHANAPKVMVDGVPVLELRLLRDLPAHLISSVRIVSSVVVIQTRNLAP